MNLTQYCRCLGRPGKSAKVSDDDDGDDDDDDDDGDDADVMVGLNCG